MTEYNLFCYSKNFNDKDSFQQARYRVFNTQVTVKRYSEIKKLVKSIIPNPDKLNLSDFWKSITNAQWSQLLAIPEAKDFKEGFEYISGQTINTTIIGQTKIVNIDGFDYQVEIKSIV
jgi:hypothetical protein